jgi:hypothetical protein
LEQARHVSLAGNNREQPGRLRSFLAHVDSKAGLTAVTLNADNGNESTPSATAEHSKLPP